VGGWGGGATERTAKENRIHREIKEESFPTADMNFSPVDTQHSATVGTSQGCKTKRMRRQGAAQLLRKLCHAFS
jgi:hypothetical protein